VGGEWGAVVLVSAAGMESSFRLITGLDTNPLAAAAFALEESEQSPPPSPRPAGDAAFSGQSCYNYLAALAVCSPWLSAAYCLPSLLCVGG
jgi:hypothetical protein